MAYITHLIVVGVEYDQVNYVSYFVNTVADTWNIIIAYPQILSNAIKFTS